LQSHYSKLITQGLEAAAGRLESNSCRRTQPRKSQLEIVADGTFGHERRQQVHDEEGQPAGHEAAHQHPKGFRRFRLRAPEGGDAGRGGRGGRHRRARRHSGHKTFTLPSTNSKMDAGQQRCVPLGQRPFITDA